MSPIPRFGSQPGDILRLRLTIGEDFDGRVFETRIEMLQATLEVNFRQVLYENRVTVATTEQAGLRAPLWFDRDPQRVPMNRDGSPASWPADANPPLLAIPTCEWAEGERWSAEARVNLYQCEPLHLLVDCRVTGLSAELMDVEMSSEPHSFTYQGQQMTASLKGAMQFALQGGYLVHGSYEICQRGPEQNWRQWFRLQTLERVGVEHGG